MGEVRVKARLTNAGDESLVRRGMLRPEEVRTCEADALVDTGSARTVLPADVASRLGLGITGHGLAEYADGRKEVVPLAEPLFGELAGRKTVDDAFVLGDEVLIGQAVLEKLDLFVDCHGQRLVPNPAHPDQAVSRV